MVGKFSEFLHFWKWFYSVWIIEQYLSSIYNFRLNVSFFQNFENIVPCVLSSNAAIRNPMSFWFSFLYRTFFLLFSFSLEDFSIFSLLLMFLKFYSGVSVFSHLSILMWRLLFFKYGKLFCIISMLASSIFSVLSFWDFYYKMFPFYVYYFLTF